MLRAVHTRVGRPADAVVVKERVRESNAPEQLRELITTLPAGTYENTAAVWEALTDPALVARLTPFLHRVTEHGEHWVWEMTRVPVLGRSFSFTFTERMTFDEPRSIVFTHEPASDHEHAGAAGRYELTPAGSGATLDIRLSVTARLPVPRAGRPVVGKAMDVVIAQMGKAFAAGLLEDLGERSRCS